MAAEKVPAGVLRWLTAWAALQETEAAGVDPLGLKRFIDSIRFHQSTRTMTEKVMEVECILAIALEESGTMEPTIFVRWLHNANKYAEALQLFDFTTGTPDEMARKTAQAAAWALVTRADSRCKKKLF